MLSLKEVSIYIHLLNYAGNEDMLDFAVKIEERDKYASAAGDFE